MNETVGQIGHSTISRETWDSVAPELEPRAFEVGTASEALFTMRNAILATMRSQAPR